MAQLIVNNLKKGDIFQKDGSPYLVMDITINTPSARGANMLVKIKGRNLLTDHVLDLKFKGGEAVDEPFFEKRSGQFLYGKEEEYMFMDLETFDQYTLDEQKIGDKKLFLIEGLDIILHLFNGNVVNIELPLVVEQTIIKCEPVLKGATAVSKGKNAVTETGLAINVPSYMKEGEKIKIDTRQKRYISRG